MKKETRAQVFSFEFCEIFKNTFFTENLQTTASDESMKKLYIAIIRSKIDGTGLCISRGLGTDEGKI